MIHLRSTSTTATLSISRAVILGPLKHVEDQVFVFQYFNSGHALHDV